MTFHGEHFTVRTPGLAHCWPGRSTSESAAAESAPCAAPAGSPTAGGPASSLPDQAAAGRTAIAAHAAEAGREIEPDHYGTSLAVAATEIPTTAIDAIARRNPAADPTEIVPVSWPPPTT